MKKYPVQVIFREYLEGIAAAIFLAIFLRVFVFSVLYMPTDNMLPGIQKGDFIIGWKLSYGFPLPLSGGERLNKKLPQRGDVVSFQFPGDVEQMVIRRIVGLPGDVISVTEGKLTINGQESEYSEGDSGWIEALEGVTEPVKLESMISGEVAELKVPEDQFFVLSDHRALGDDSRTWGLIPMVNLDSRLKWIWLSVDNQNEAMEIRWDRMFTEIL